MVYDDVFEFDAKVHLSENQLFAIGHMTTGEFNKQPTEEQIGKFLTYAIDCSIGFAEWDYNKSARDLLDEVRAG